MWVLWTSILKAILFFCSIQIKLSVVFDKVSLSLELCHRIQYVAFEQTRLLQRDHEGSIYHSCEKERFQSSPPSVYDDSEIVI